MQRSLLVAGRDLHCGVFATGRRPADEQRQIKSPSVHLLRNVAHFVERRRDQPAETNHVHVFLAGGLQNLVARHHHAKVDDLVVVAAQHHADDVFADVVHVALDGGHEDFTARRRAGLGLLLLHERLQISDCFFHDARAFDDLRQEHFSRAEQVADDVHAVHQRPLDDVNRASKFLPRLLGVGLDVLDDPLDERVAQPLLDGSLAPGIGHLLGLALLLDRLGKLDEPLGGIGTAIQQNVLDALKQVGWDFLVHLEHTGVDDAHVQPGANRVVEERRVHRLAHAVVAAKRKRNVADPAADLGQGQRRLDDARGLDETHRVVVVLLHAGSDGENVRVKNNVLRRETDFARQQIVRARANLNATLGAVGLALPVERHHHHRRAVPADQPRLF